LKAKLRAVQRAYTGDSGEERPLAGYLGAMTTYATVVGAIAGLPRATGRDVPDGLDARQVALSAIATHKLSLLLAKDPITSPLRAPFTVYRGQEGPAELREDVRGTPVHARQSVSSSPARSALASGLPPA
jgi:Protein of unknown function (DUF1360)